MGIEQQLWAHFGSPAEAEHQVAERTYYMVAMLALDSVPKMHLAEDPRRWAYTEGAFEAVAHTFAEEIIQLRALLRAACRQVHGEAEVQALTARLVDAFIVGAPGPSHARRRRHTRA